MYQVPGNLDFPVSQNRVKNLFYRVYGWMSLALLLTGCTAWLIASNPRWMNVLVTRPFLGLSLLLVQLVVVVIFAAMLAKLSFPTALALFLSYAFLSGATLSIIFRVYALSSIIQSLLITAGMFGSFSLYGFVTQADLSKMGSLVRMALWGLILALIVNLFLRNSFFNLVLSCIGVVLFSALTAYDTYMIKRYAMSMEMANSDDYGKVGLFGAFQLYLDFINLFLNLLNLTGRRRQ